MPSGDAEVSGIPETTGTNLESLSSKFNGIVRRARAALFWERAWPRLVPPLAVTGLFASASMLGAWKHASPEIHLAGALVAAAAFIASPFLWKTKSLTVKHDEAIKRIETVTGTTNRQAQTFDDHLEARSSASDRAIFDLQRREIWSEWGDKFKAGTPHPNVAVRDPFRLRYAVAVLTIVSAAVANVDALHRLHDAVFEWPDRPVVVAKLPPIEVKAWTTPPEGVNDPPPLVLDQNSKDNEQGGDRLFVHKNSQLTILTFESDVTVAVNGQDIPAKAIGAKDNAQTKPTFQHEIMLPEGDATISIGRGANQRLTWHFQILPDNSPTASIDSVGKDEKDPNALNLNYKRKDDYGVTESTVKMAPVTTLDPGAKPLPSAKLPEIKIP